MATRRRADDGASLKAIEASAVLITAERFSSPNGSVATSAPNRIAKLGQLNAASLDQR